MKIRSNGVPLIIFGFKCYAIVICYASHGYLNISSSSSMPLKTQGDKGEIGLSVGLETRLGLDMRLASLSRQSSSLLSTSVGALPKLPILLTVSSASPFSQQSAVSYLSRLLRRDCFRERALKDRFLRKSVMTRGGRFGSRMSRERASEEEKSSSMQGMIFCANLFLRATRVKVEEFEVLHCQSFRNSRSMGVAFVLKLKTQRVTRPRSIGMLATMMATLFSTWLMQ